MLRLQHRKLEEKVWLEIVDPNEEVEEKEDVKVVLGLQVREH